MDAQSFAGKVVIPVDNRDARTMAVAIGQDLAHRMGVPAELFSIDSGEHVSRELGQVVAESGALVCLASSARTALVETVSSSVSASVIGNTHRPVIVVGPRCVALRGSQLAIALDGTIASEWILEPALQLAEATALEPVLYLVAPERGPGLDSDAHAGAYLAEVASRFQLRHGALCYELLHDRRVGRALANLAMRDDVAIFAMSSHGMLAHERLLLPSVTHHVIRHARCPLFVGSRDVPEEPPFDHGSGPRVVVGIDGSSADRFAIEFAADAAGRRHATLELVHAWPRAWYLSTDGTLGGTIAETAEREAHESLQRAAAIASGFAPDINVRTWLVGRATSDALIEAAVGADLVVLGERRYNLIEELVLGSTTTDVLQRALAPVAVVPEPAD